MRPLAALLLASAPLFAAGLTATKTKDAVEFKDGDALVTKYVFGGDIPKPHFWPLNAPGGTRVTQTMPADHKHHRSVWFCHGDVIPEGITLKTKSSDKRVAGVDFWSEHEGHGKIVCVEVGEPKAETGGVSVITRNEWRTPDGEKILDEVRVLTVRKLDKGYLVAFDIDLHAGVCGITFGDTKEGAFGTRVHEAIGAPKNPGGTFTADHDRTTEKPIWGQPIDWMDYSGKVEGKEVGLSVFDHPKNPVRATSHGRAYGLVAANPFGRDKSFPSQKGKTELVTLKKGEHLKLKYAAYAHTGDQKSGSVEEAYKLFADK
ncbi:MAG: PmoA family protein [Fimbriiglobus sp.]|jgi:hypothetical protein|nr:PmoA family protein [Fimbriiglobus sp.]